MKLGSQPPIFCESNFLILENKEGGKIYKFLEL